MALVVSGLLIADTVQVDPAIPAYKPVTGVSGNLKSIGSDTLNNLMTFWAEGFKKAVPEREHPDRGQGLVDRAARPDRGDGPVRADVAAR